MLCTTCPKTAPNQCRVQQARLKSIAAAAAGKAFAILGPNLEEWQVQIPHCTWTVWIQVRF